MFNYAIVAYQTESSGPIMNNPACGFVFGMKVFNFVALHPGFVGKIHISKEPDDPNQPVTVVRYPECFEITYEAVKMLADVR